MDIQTDRAFVAADRPAVRYCTVTVTAPKSARAGDSDTRPAPRDVSLVIRDSMGARTRCLSDFPVEPDVDGLHIELGDLFLTARNDVTLVLATEICPKAHGASTAILLRLGDRDRVLYGAPMDVTWTSVDADANRTQPVNREVIMAAAKLLVERARAEVIELSRVGAHDRAGKVLDKAIARIRAMGEGLRDVQRIANRFEDSPSKVA